MSIHPLAPAAPGHTAVAPAETALTSADFRFVFHGEPERFFRSAHRPLRVIHTPPAIETYTNAIYKPATRGWYPFDGCLYDSERQRIQATCLRRWRHDMEMNSEPARYDNPPADLPTYDRPVLYLGFLHPAYGHFLLEVMSYWWALAERAGEFDRFLVLLHDPKVLDKAHIKACLAALGIDREQIVYFDKPTRLRSVTVPSPSIQLNSHIHTSYRAFVGKLATALGAADARPTDQPLYVSRSGLAFGKDKYRGEEQIEAFLQQKGVRVIHPQKIPFVEQVGIFNAHRRVLGTIGSGMHNIVLSLNTKTMTYFTAYDINDNYFLVDKCFGADSTFVMSCRRSDRARVLLGNLKKGVLGKRNRNDGFLITHDLDYPRVVRWLETSGDL